MPKSLGEPEPTEGRVEPSDIEQLDQSSGRYAPQEEKTSSEGTSSPPDESVRPADTEAKGAAQSQEWWSTSQPAGEWAQPAATTAAADGDVPQPSATADVYLCGQKTLLSLIRGPQSIPRQPAIELVQHYGQRLFSQLWSVPSVWIMFEKNAELLSDASDVSAEPNVDDWALETLRFVQSLDQHVNFNPASIPAYTKD